LAILSVSVGIQPFRIKLKYCLLFVSVAKKRLQRTSSNCRL